MEKRLLFQQKRWNMLKERNNLLDFFQRFIFFIIILFAISVFNRYGFAVVSSQQCDRELEKYCSSSVYNSTEQRLNCVREKQKYFTYECVGRILGINDDAIYRNDTEIEPEPQQFNEDDVLILDDNITKLEQDNSIQQTTQSEDDTDQIIQQQKKQISALTAMILNSNCTSDMILFCKTKIKKGNVTIQETVDKCIDRMVKNELRLTLSCRFALMNLINIENKNMDIYYDIKKIGVGINKTLKQLKKEGNKSE